MQSVVKYLEWIIDHAIPRFKEIFANNNDVKALENSKTG